MFLLISLVGVLCKCTWSEEGCCFVVTFMEPRGLDNVTAKFLHIICFHIFMASRGENVSTSQNDA